MADLAPGARNKGRFEVWISECSLPVARRDDLEFKCTRGKSNRNATIVQLGSSNSSSEKGATVIVVETRVRKVGRRGGQRPASFAHIFQGSLGDGAIIILISLSFFLFPAAQTTSAAHTFSSSLSALSHVHGGPVAALGRNVAVADAAAALGESSTAPNAEGPPDCPGRFPTLASLGRHESQGDGLRTRRLIPVSGGALLAGTTDGG
jgi:hypothetical protein